MKCCVVIPCFDHSSTVATVAREAAVHCPVIVVDDGSTAPLPPMPECSIIRLGSNCGKGAALRAGLSRATDLGFTHAISMDADGQHFSEDLPQFLAVAASQPSAFVVGVRDFRAAGCPTHRRRSNAASTFWFRMETGVRLGDTQCGFRCYPLELWRRLQVSSGRYAFELEVMVRASWAGAPIIGVPVRCSYAQGTRNSHFRPLVDLAHITLVNIRLVAQAWVVPRMLRAAWSRGESWTLRETVHEFLSENAHRPSEVALAVGLGLFCGIAPFWGFQMLIAAACAHRLRLNKAITLLASNISLPPMLPLILAGSMEMGHWIFTGKALDWAPLAATKVRAADYVWEWIAGSFALAGLVAASGAVITYAVACLAKEE